MRRPVFVDYDEGSMKGSFRDRCGTNRVIVEVMVEVEEEWVEEDVVALEVEEGGTRSHIVLDI